MTALFLAFVVVAAAAEWAGEIAFDQWRHR